MMQASTDLSIITLILQASWVVQGVMMILLMFTLQSWYLIARKWMSFWVVARRTKKFESHYKSAEDIAEVYDSIQLQPRKSALEGVFIVGVDELKKVARSKREEKNLLIDNIRRAMLARLQKEMDELEQGLNTLATIGSVSPYIGLFGTVWGIMNSFRALADVSQATLSHVAPGIAEALVATAIGLFAAIPAVLAYNALSNQITRFQSQFESFIDEFQNVVALHLY
jgi:biopolymer transport protein TolQ